MKRFFYIVAYLPPGAPADSPAQVAFRHVSIEAEDAEDAYGRGMELLDDRIEGKLLNNYVIEIPKEGSDGMA